VLNLHLALTALKDDELAELHKDELESLATDSVVEFRHTRRLTVKEVKRARMRKSVAAEVKAREKIIRDIAKRQLKSWTCRCSLPWWCVYINYVSQCSLLATKLCTLTTVLLPGTSNVGFQASRFA
jgi:hypothetical protein